jgi:MoxR-like ATPase
LARAFGDILAYRVRTLPLYQEMTARDLLQRRITESDGSGDGTSKNKTAWVDSPLIAAAKSGDLCILDGIERSVGV